MYVSPSNHLINIYSYDAKGVCWIALKKALERLGYGKCYHMSEWAIHPEHTDFWSRAVAAKYEDGPKISKKEWDSILSSYQVHLQLSY